MTKKAIHFFFLALPPALILSQITALNKFEFKDKVSKPFSWLSLFGFPPRRFILGTNTLMEFIYYLLKIIECASSVHVFGVFF